MYFKSTALLTAVLSIVSLSVVSYATAQSPADWIGNGESRRGHSLIVAKTMNANEYASYSKQSGKWTTFQFPDGVSVAPVVGETVAAFYIRSEELKQLVAIDRNGNWKTCDLSRSHTTGDSPIAPVLGNDVVVYQIGRTTYAFSGLTGTWDTSDRNAEPIVTADTAMLAASNQITVFSAKTGAWSESPKLKSKK
jgi:hypothetical protein